ncbi:MAG: hypothetical protein ACKVT1_12950 [Dehalococcoidia bacterium]
MDEGEAAKVRRMVRGYARMNEFEIAELRASTDAENFRDFALLFGTGADLGWFAGREEEDRAVRERWARLERHARRNV